MADPNKRTPKGADVFHMTLQTPTGALSNIDSHVSLDDIFEYVRARMVAETPPVVPPSSEGDNS